MGGTIAAINKLIREALEGGLSAPQTVELDADSYAQLSEEHFRRCLARGTFPQDLNHRFVWQAGRHAVIVQKSR